MSATVHEVPPAAKSNLDVGKLMLFPIVTVGHSNEAQLAMSVLELLLGEAATTERPPKPQAFAGTRGIARADEAPARRFRRVEIELVPPEVEREGRDAFERIGEDTSEPIERRPASAVVVLVRPPKFVRRDRAECDLRGRR